MPRKGPAPRRELMPDPIYRSVLVTQIVNKVLLHGKRSTAENIVYSALSTIEEKTGTEPISTLKRAIENVKPQLQVKSRRVGGATYATALDLELGLDVLDGPLEGGDRLGAGLLLDDVEGGVDDALGGGALAPDEHLVDDLRDEDRPVDRVGHQLTAGGGSLAGHYESFLAP
jgi:hypothetical protein